MVISFDVASGAGRRTRGLHWMVTMQPVEFYEHMYLIRAFEDSLHELFAKGKLFGTIHTCLGQEADAVGVMGALGKDDIVFSNHRGHGHYIEKTGDVDGLMAEVMGRQTGVCGGRGGSQHLCNREFAFYSNGIQGGIVPNATGMALAEKIKGTGNIATVFLGDGTLGEGAVYESFNIASKWAVPVLFVIENNQYAQSTYFELTVSGDIGARPRAFGIETYEMEVTEVAGVRAAAEVAIDYVRTLLRPYALVLHTYRLGPHSKGDDTRDPDEIAAYKAKDPMFRLRAMLDEPIAEEIEAKCRDRIQEAIRKAEQAPWPQHD